MNKYEILDLDGLYAAMHKYSKNEELCEDRFYIDKRLVKNIYVQHHKETMSIMIQNKTKRIIMISYLHRERIDVRDSILINGKEYSLSIEINEKEKFLKFSSINGIIDLLEMHRDELKEIADIVSENSPITRFRKVPSYQEFKMCIEKHGQQKEKMILRYSDEAEKVVIHYGLKKCITVDYDKRCIIIKQYIDSGNGIESFYSEINELNKFLTYYRPEEILKLLNMDWKNLKLIADRCLEPLRIFDKQGNI